MRYLSLIIMLAALLLPGRSYGAEAARIDSARFDFGFVPANATVSHRIWIHAGENDTLQLVDVKTGCGCVSSPWKVSTLAPGDSLALVFYWQTRGSTGRRDQSAYLYLEPTPEPVEINLSGNVVTSEPAEASVSWRPGVVHPVAGSDDRPGGTFELTNRTDDTLNVKLIEADAGMMARVPEKIAPGGRLTGRIDVPEPGVAYEGSLTLELSGNRTEPFRVSVPVQYGDFSFRPLFTTDRK